MTTAQDTDRSRILKGIVEGHARRDAALFVDEFGTPLDPNLGGWDTTAWGETVSELRRAGNEPTNEELDILWPLYRAVLMERTEELCGV